MSNIKKLMMTAAGGAALNVEDVFSTYLYEGDDANAQVISNGVDLYNEGGLIWTKSRDAIAHALISSQDYTKKLVSNTTAAYASTGTIVPDSGGNGYTVPYSDDATNLYNYRYASWTFRKAPKFFDVVTYTGNGVAGRTVSHNLGSVPGCMIVKKTSAAEHWTVYHRSTGATKWLELNLTGAAQTGSTIWNDTEPTSTEFTVGSYGGVNGSGATYVAYLFAHNDGDGNFGPTGDQDIIKCGSYVGDATDYQKIDLGFEAQWVITKRVSGTSNWDISDNMRGLTVDDNRKLEANSFLAETTETFKKVYNNGFMVSGNNSDSNAVTHTYIYIAIRRGPMAVPESATDVFAVDTGSTSDPAFDSGFPVDFAIMTEKTSNTDRDVATRMLQGSGLKTNSTAAEVTGYSNFVFDFMNGWDTASYSTNSLSWMWRRAPSFMDVVAYTGTGTTNVLNHNLGVPPEFIILKRRDGVVNWWTYFNFTSTTLDRTELNKTDPADLNISYSLGYGIQSQPTDTQVEISPYNNTNWNTASAKYIMYLFASLDGISKIGTYTGNGTTQNIDCGFTSGARFVLIKRISGVGSWHLFDATRGIVSGNDPHLALNVAASEITTDDSVDPLSSGFTVNQVAATDINVSSSTYLYYAIA